MVAVEGAATISGAATLALQGIPISLPRIIPGPPMKWKKKLRHSVSIGGG
jgi:hypothetical protein